MAEWLTLSKLRATRSSNQPRPGTLLEATTLTINLLAPIDPRTMVSLACSNPRRACAYSISCTLRRLPLVEARRGNPLGGGTFQFDSAPKR